MLIQPVFLYLTHRQCLTKRNCYAIINVITIFELLFQDLWSRATSVALETSNWLQGKSELCVTRCKRWTCWLS